jgi:hypothetical protein
MGKYSGYPIVDSDQRPEHAKFYDKIETDYNALLIELMQIDCKRVEYIRGMLFVLSEIKKNKSHWKIEMQDPFKTYK